MFKLALFIAVCYIAYRIIRKNVRNAALGGRQTERLEKDSVLVPCAECGTHVDAEVALERYNSVFCGEECAKTYYKKKS